jgi:hypothetical protein
LVENNLDKIRKKLSKLGNRQKRNLSIITIKSNFMKITVKESHHYKINVLKVVQLLAPSIGMFSIFGKDGTYQPASDLETTLQINRSYM